MHLDLIPEAFIGKPDAPFLLLGNNPGAKSPMTVALRREPAFANRMRRNLLHTPSNFPFLYLDPDPVIPSPSRDWWETKLKPLFDEFGADQAVARSILGQCILAVEFFPYVSHRYRHGRLTLPSQQYSFSLVRKARVNGAFIVLTRGKRRWLETVKELEGYSRLIQFKNVQKAPISYNNCDIPKRYEELVRAIKGVLP